MKNEDRGDGSEEGQGHQDATGLDLVIDALHSSFFCAGNYPR